MNERVPLAFLVPLRLLAGVILVVAGYSKFQGGWLHGDALLKIVNGWLEAGKSYPFFLSVVQSAQAHPKIFGALITLGELVVGTSMVLGLLTRLTSFLGALLMFSVAFAGGQTLSPAGNALLLGSILFTFIFLPPGRVLGIDQVLRTRVPRWLV